MAHADLAFTARSEGQAAPDRVRKQFVIDMATGLTAAPHGMRDHGRLPDYIKQYGSKYDPDHTGDSGEDIYAADMAKLMAAERAYHEASGVPRTRQSKTELVALNEPKGQILRFDDLGTGNAAFRSSRTSTR